MPQPKWLVTATLTSARVKIADDGLSGVMTCFYLADGSGGVPLSLSIPRAVLERLGGQIQRELARVPKPQRVAIRKSA
jgi:hypothetical protein